jgi:AcrR family transcriptional regulator
VDTTKKECILIEAARAFARFGFKKASIDEIAKEAGVGKGTVYLAAESKEDLFFQVLHREVRAWQAACAKAIDPRAPADQLLARLLAVADKYLEDHPLVEELLLGRTLEMLPAWGARLEDLRAIGRANVTEVLRLGIRQGIFRPELDAETVAGLLQDFHLVAWLARSKETPTAEVVHRAAVGLDLVLRGLLAPERAHGGTAAGATPHPPRLHRRR